MKLFRVTVSTDRTDYIVTNDLSQGSTDEVQEVSVVCWKIEEFHRGVKQLTGIEAMPLSLSLEFNAIISLARFWLGLT